MSRKQEPESFADAMRRIGEELKRKDPWPDLMARAIEARKKAVEMRDED